MPVSWHKEPMTPDDRATAERLKRDAFRRCQRPNWQGVVGGLGGILVLGAFRLQPLSGPMTITMLLVGTAIIALAIWGVVRYLRAMNVLDRFYLAALKDGIAKGTIIVATVETERVIPVRWPRENSDELLLDIGPEGYMLLDKHVLDQVPAWNTGSFPRRIEMRKLENGYILTVRTGPGHARVETKLSDERRDRIEDYLNRYAETGEVGAEDPFPTVQRDIVER